MGCSKIVLHLQKRGHKCAVLTSSFGATSHEMKTGIFRILHHSFNENDKPKRFGALRSVLLDLKNRVLVRRSLHRFKPDMVFIFNPMFLTPGVLVQAANSKQPVYFLVSDEWLCDWAGVSNRHYKRIKYFYSKIPIGPIIKRLLNPLGLTTDIELPDIRNLIFVSNYLRSKAKNSGINVDESNVVHWGIERNKYLVEREWGETASRVLFCGQLSAHKDPETVIRAFAVVKKSLPANRLVLTLSGPAHCSKYLNRLTQLVASLKLEDSVQFTGQVENEQIPELLKENDIFVFSSTWQEPFSIVLVEAMTAGLAIVSTRTGGTGELLQHQVNGLCYKAGNIEECATSIIRILKEPELGKQLSFEAEQSTRALTLENMVDKIENLLMCSVGQRAHE